MSSVTRIVTPYFYYARLSFLEMLAFRTRYFTGIFTYLIHVSVYWFIWEAVYEHAESIAGFSLSQMTTYVAIGWISRTFYFNDVDWEINEQVTSGKIALDLIKPIDFQLMHYAHAFGASLFRVVLFAAPSALVICSVFPVRGPAGIGELLGFAAATFLAFVINLQLNFLIGLISFVTQNIWGIIRVKYIAMQLLTGLIVPIKFYPEIVQKIMYATPFPYIADIPLSLYLGKLSATEIGMAFMVSSIWILILFMLGQIFWLRCRNQLIVQGG